MRGAAAAFLLLLLAAALAGCALPIGEVPGPRGGGAASSPPAADASHRALETEIHSLVNRERAALGLRRLQYDERLAAIARQHSADMAAGRVPFGHAGFEARSAAIERAMRRLSVAENVAYDSRAAPAERIVANWMRSEGHRRNIVGAFQLTGIGVARADDGLFYATQIFVRVP